MKRITGVVLVVWLTIAVAAASKVLAQTSPILIVGLQTGSSTSASQELIELANVSAQMVDLNQFQLRYFSASSKDMITASRTIKMTGLLQPNGRYLMSSPDYKPEADQIFSATLAAAGGHLQLTQGSAVLDTVGWGTAMHAPGQAAPAPAPGDSLTRQLDANGHFLTTGNNMTDFTPAENLPVIPEAIAATVQLSELLPNPASPDTDATGEYIELNNYGSSLLSLSGYRLVAGPNLGKSFSFGDESLAPGQFRAFYVTETKLALSNSGSRVKLIDPSGEVINDITYETAKDGLAWALQDNVWQWTKTPTPGEANATVPVVDSTAGGSTKPASKPKATSSSKATVRKGQVKAASTKVGAAAVEDNQATKPSLHNGVVAGVGGLAVLYGAYEYRQDIANFYRKLRGHRKTG